MKKTVRHAFSSLLREASAIKLYCFFQLLLWLSSGHVFASYAYVSASLQSYVYEIDTTTNTFVGPPPEISIPKPYGVAINPNGQFVYVANYLTDSVTVINSTDNAVATTILVGTRPYYPWTRENSVLLGPR